MDLWSEQSEMVVAFLRSSSVLSVFLFIYLFFPGIEMMLDLKIKTFMPVCAAGMRVSVHSVYKSAVKLSLRK